MGLYVTFVILLFYFVSLCLLPVVSGFTADSKLNSVRDWIGVFPHMKKT